MTYQWFYHSMKQNCVMSRCYKCFPSPLSMGALEPVSAKEMLCSLWVSGDSLQLFIHSSGMWLLSRGSRMTRQQHYCSVRPYTATVLSWMSGKKPMFNYYDLWKFKLASSQCREAARVKTTCSAGGRMQVAAPQAPKESELLFQPGHLPLCCKKKCVGFRKYWHLEQSICPSESSRQDSLN